MAKAPKFGSDADFSKHVAQPSNIAHNGADYFFAKGRFVTFSSGVGSMGRPILLDADGKIDQSVLTLHAAEHEVGGSDLISHDDLTDFVADEHIDWTNASAAFLTTGILGCGGPFTVIQNSDEFEISLDGDNVYFKWSDGYLVLQSAEATANTNVHIMGNDSSSYGQLRIYDEDNAEWLQFTCSGGAASIKVDGTSPGQLAINIDDVVYARFMFNNADVTLDSTGCLCLKETTTPTATTDYGKIYTKNDNALYFQDGANVEHEVALVSDCKFSAYISAEQQDLVYNTWTTVEFNTEEFDLGSDFNISTYTFTAPVTGYYFFHASIELNGLAVGWQKYNMRLYKNSSASIAWRQIDETFDAITREMSMNLSCFVYLSATDTIVVDVKNDWSSGSTMDVSHLSAVSTFQGFRVI